MKRNIFANGAGQEFSDLPVGQLAFPQIGQSGGTMRACKPGFPGGPQISPTTVQIIQGP
jgi:hypothetical protein